MYVDDDDDDADVTTPVRLLTRLRYESSLVATFRSRRQQTLTLTPSTSRKAGAVSEVVAAVWKTRARWSCWPSRWPSSLSPSPSSSSSSSASERQSSVTVLTSPTSSTATTASTKLCRTEALRRMDVWRETVPGTWRHRRHGRVLDRALECVQYRHPLWLTVDTHTLWLQHYLRFVSLTV